MHAIWIFCKCAEDDFICTYIYTHTHTPYSSSSPFFSCIHPHNRACAEKYIEAQQAQAGAGGGGSGNGGGARGRGILQFLVVPPVSPEDREREKRREAEREWQKLQRQHNDYNARLEALETLSTPLGDLKGFGNNREEICKTRLEIDTVEKLAKLSDAECIRKSKSNKYLNNRAWQKTIAEGVKSMRDLAKKYVDDRRQRLQDHPPPFLPPRPNPLPPSPPRPPPGGNDGRGGPNAGGTDDDDWTSFGAFHDPDGYGGLIVSDIYMADLINAIDGKTREDRAGRVRSVTSSVWKLDWTFGTADMV